MMTSHVKRWPASSGYHQVCSEARRARLYQHTSATVCRLVCVTRPPLPRAPWLRRHYPPSSLLRAHARVLWPPCPFDLGLVGTGLRRLCHPRLVHRTVLALTVWLLPKVSCPVRRVLTWCMWSVSSQVTTAFTTDGWFGALPVLPRATTFDAAGILFDYDPLVHLPSWSLPRSYARRGLCRSSLLGIRFLSPSRASYPAESTNFRGRIRTC